MGMYVVVNPNNTKIWLKNVSNLNISIRKILELNYEALNMINFYFHTWWECLPFDTPNMEKYD